MPSAQHNPRIQALTDALVATHQPDKVVLFGSWAYGTPTPTSDIDLLVVLPFEGRSFRKALSLYDCLGSMAEGWVDLKVYTPQEVAWRYEGFDPLVRDALDKGKILYERK